VSKQADPDRKSGRSAAPSASAIRRVLEESSDLFLLLGPDGAVRWAGAGVGRFLGRNPEEIVGTEFASLAHLEDRERSQRALQGWMGDPEGFHAPFENRLLARGGLFRPVVWSITVLTSPQGKVTGLAAIARDTTQQKRFEQALLESDARHRALLKGVLDPLITIDLQGIIHSVSDSVEPVFGYRPDELVGRNISILMPEPYRSEHDGYLDRYRATGKTRILGRTREFDVIHKDGEAIACELSVARVDIPGQAEPLFTGSFRDTRRRKAAEAALREREQRLRAIFDQEFQHVGLLDPAGRLIETNQASLDLIGARREDVVGKPYPDTPWWADSPESRKKLLEAIPRVLAGEFVRFESEFSDENGAFHIIDFSLKPVRDSNGEVVMMIPEGRDITELKRAQKSEHQMLRALAEVGESAALLAHEIKNPITAVNFALKAVADKLGEDSREVIEDLAQRMQHLERKLRGTLSFVKPIALDPVECNSLALLRAPVEILKPELVSIGVLVDIDPHSLSASFVADQALIQDVLVNLVRNAGQAVSPGGRIELSSRSAPTGQIELIVEDDGPGIPEDSRETLFKPFVTTRAEGTGLGLAICRRIVEEHGGRIAVGDSPMGGARFVVRLPQHCREIDA
jgi:PAS domain S-box-containing protein